MLVNSLTVEARNPYFMKMWTVASSVCLSRNMPGHTTANHKEHKR